MPTQKKVTIVDGIHCWVCLGAGFPAMVVMDEWKLISFIRNTSRASKYSHGRI